MWFRCSLSSRTVADRVKLTRLILNDAHRHVLADITSIPRIIK